jgi:uracil DNA glycosylase
VPPVSLIDVFPTEKWTALVPEFGRDYMSALASALEVAWAEKRAYPPRKAVFRAFRLTCFDEAKVVVVANDPYPNPRHATGWLSLCRPARHRCPRVSAASMRSSSRIPSSVRASRAGRG